MKEFYNEVTCNFECCLHFDGKDNNPELSAIVFALKNVNLWYKNETNGHLFPVSIYDILKAPKNIELLRKKICEQDFQEEEEEEDPEEGIIDVF